MIWNMWWMHYMDKGWHCLFCPNRCSQGDVHMDCKKLQLKWGIIICRHADAFMTSMTEIGFVGIIDDSWKQFAFPLGGIIVDSVLQPNLMTAKCVIWSSGGSHVIRWLYLEILHFLSTLKVGNQGYGTFLVEWHLVGHLKTLKCLYGCDIDVN